MVLTGVSRAGAEQMMRSNARDTRRLVVGGAYYLSDGGYSRIVFFDGSRTVRLTWNSTDAVKARWAECPAEVQQVQAEVLKVFDSGEW
jgi:hypothetical protein